MSRRRPAATSIRSPGDRFMRFSYAGSHEDMVAAIDRIGRWLAAIAGIKKPGQAPVFPCLLLILGCAQKKPLRCHQPPFLGLPSSTGPVVDTTTGCAGAAFSLAGLRRDGRNVSTASSRRRLPACRRLRRRFRRPARRCLRLGNRCRRFDRRRGLGNRLGGRFGHRFGGRFRYLLRLARRALRLGCRGGFGLRLGGWRFYLDGCASTAATRSRRQSDLSLAGICRHRPRRQQPLPSRLRADGCACRRACRAGASCGRPSPSAACRIGLGALVRRLDAVVFEPVVVVVAA